MNNEEIELQATILKIVSKPLGILHDTPTLKEILKRRLTKKELKVLLEISRPGADIDTLKTKLSLDDTRYAKILNNINKKLNNDNIKNEIFS